LSQLTCLWAKKTHVSVFLLWCMTQTIVGGGCLFGTSVCSLSGVLHLSVSQPYCVVRRVAWWVRIQCSLYRCYYPVFPFNSVFSLLLYSITIGIHPVLSVMTMRASGWTDVVFCIIVCNMLSYSVGGRFSFLTFYWRHSMTVLLLLWLPECSVDDGRCRILLSLMFKMYDPRLFLLV
jgi:hypothetical protein